MTNKEFVRLLENISKMKTYYIKGGFGHVLKASNKKRLIDQYKYNKDRADKINALDPSTFAFDCCGLVKAVLWGFTGDRTKTYGGAVYKANLIDDVNETGLLKLCKDVKEDLSNLTPGDFLWTNKPNGHCGIYAGNGKVIECTPAGKCGVQITDLNRVKWLKSGKLPLINYEETSTPAPVPAQVNIYHIVRRGETLSKIAGMHGFKSWRDLWALNPEIRNPNLIFVGQRIKIK
jgi:nucleoid-associated protein YgaU